MTRATCASLALVLCGTQILGGCGGGSSSPGTPGPTLNPSPSITALTPPSAMAGSANISVSISGSGFIASSAAQWNGTPVATTFGSASNLSATLTVSDLANGTVGKLTVVNPARSEERRVGKECRS